MKKAYADVHIITTLDDIVWLFNIRGNDIPCNPVVLSYLMVTGENLFFYVNPQVISDEVRSYLESLGVTIRPYNDIYAERPYRASGEEPCELCHLRERADPEPDHRPDESDRVRQVPEK